MAGYLALGLENVPIALTSASCPPLHTRLISRAPHPLVQRFLNLVVFFPFSLIVFALHVIGIPAVTTRPRQAQSRPRLASAVGERGAGHAVSPPLLAPVCLRQPGTLPFCKLSVAELRPEPDVKMSFLKARLLFPFFMFLSLLSLPAATEVVCDRSARLENPHLCGEQRVSCATRPASSGPNASASPVLRTSACLLGIADGPRRARVGPD